MPTSSPPPPQAPDPDRNDWRFELHRRVQEALLALPGYFRTKTSIEGLDAQDLFTLNTTLGATIEQQVVETLNSMREVWDPDDHYKRYRFERYAQTFPDVRLIQRETDGSQTTAFGIELKGWYLLSKEAEPSFRYRVSPGFVSEWDLLVVVPWYLDNVLSGSPVALAPFIKSAKLAAEYRNHWWQHIRSTTTDTTISPPDKVWLPPPWPTKSNELSDRPVRDGGGNFGRVARIGIMDEWVQEQRLRPVAGIAVENWITFFGLYTEGQDEATIRSRLDEMATRAAGDQAPTVRERVADLLDELFALLGY